MSLAHTSSDVVAPFQKMMMDEQSASLLMLLKNSSEDTSPPSSSASPSPSEISDINEINSPFDSPCPSGLEDGKCLLNNCLLCARGVPALLVRSPTWASIMRVVFYCLQQDNPSKYFFNLKTDVYGFMTTHWKKLCLDKKRSDNWHKQIQDMLSHSKNLFESGMERYKQNGFWRMKQTQDPWTIRKDRKSNKLKRSSDSIESDQRKKRSRKDDVSSEDSEDCCDISSSPEDHSRTDLENEVHSLKETIASLTQHLESTQAELKKRDQEVAEKTYSYYRLVEQFRQLQQQHASCKSRSFSHDLLVAQKQWDSFQPSFPQFSPPSSQRFCPFPRNILAPSSPNKFMNDEDEDFFVHNTELVPQIRLSPLNV